MSTAKNRKQRSLIEFIERRGGRVTVRDVINTIGGSR
jgi:hypothetical protein